MQQLKFQTIDLSRHKDKAIKYRADSFICSIGDTGNFKPNEYIAWLQEKINNTPELAVHAWLDDKIIGQIEISIPPSQINIKQIYVNLYYITENYRGSGYGTKLHEYVLNIAKKYNLCTVDLSVAIENKHAIKFYDKLGFKKQKAIKRGGINCYIMQLTI